jgi:hypothetical protein
MNRATLSIVAAFHGCRGQFDEAAAAHSALLELVADRIDHPDYVAALRAAAAHLIAQSKCLEAATRVELAVGISTQRSLSAGGGGGTGSLELAEARLALASALMFGGQFTQAEKIAREVSVSCDVPRVVRVPAMHLRRHCLALEGQSGAAVLILEALIKEQEQQALVGKPDSMETLLLRSEMVDLLTAAGRYAEAHELACKVCRKVQSLPVTHDERLKASTALTLACMALGKPIDPARKFMQAAIEKYHSDRGGCHAHGLPDHVVEAQDILRRLNGAEPHVPVDVWVCRFAAAKQEKNLAELKSEHIAEARRKEQARLGRELACIVQDSMATPIEWPSLQPLQPRSGFVTLPRAQGTPVAGPTTPRAAAPVGTAPVVAASSTEGAAPQVMPPPAAVLPFRGLLNKESLQKLAGERAFWGRNNAQSLQAGDIAGKVVQASVLG